MQNNIQLNASSDEKWRQINARRWCAYGAAVVICHRRKATAAQRQSARRFIRVTTPLAE